MQFLPTSYLLPTYFLTSLGHLGHLGPPDLFKKTFGSKSAAPLRAGGFRMWRRGGSFRDPSDELVGGGVDLFVEC